MKSFYCFFLCAFLFSCGQALIIEKSDPFQAFLAPIPELVMPFTAHSSQYLESNLMPDTAYNQYNDPNASWIYGKIKVNDSISAVIFLLAGDDVFPELITYDANGKKLSELTMTHLPGGSTGYDENGTSHVIMQKDFSIVITDTIYHFQRDSLHEIIDSTKIMEVVRECYKIDPKGTIKSISSPRCAGK